MASSQQLAGIGVALTAATLESLGLQVQKLAHIRRTSKEAEAQDIVLEDLSLVVAQEEEDGKVQASEGQSIVARQRRCRWRCPCRNCGYIADTTWMGGFGIFLVGNALDAVALSFTPQSLVSLLGAWTLVVNGCTAPKLLGERFSYWDASAAGVISLGITCCLFSSERNGKITLDALMARFSEPVVTCYIALVVLAIIVLRIALIWRHSQWRRAWPAVGALTGSITLATANATMGLVGTSLQSGQNQFNSWKAAILLTMFVLSMPLQIHYINISLSLNDALFHIPMYFVIWNLLSIVTGALVYKEMSDFEERSWFLFPAGVVLLFVGVVMSAQRESSAKGYSDSLSRDSPPREDSARRPSISDKGAGTTMCEEDVTLDVGVWQDASQDAGTSSLPTSH